MNGEISKKDFMDSVSTHPSINERLEKLKENLQAPSAGESFVGSPVTFLNIREMARFELLEIHLEGMNYQRALYESLQLLNEYPNNQYVKEMVCKSAYWYTHMENQSAKDLFSPTPSDYEEQIYGDFADYFNGIGKIRRKKWCLSLLNHYSQKNPDNIDIKFLLAQGEEQFGEDSKAKALYEALLPMMKETHGAFIQEKIDTL